MMKSREFVIRRSIYPTTAPVELRSLAIWGIEGMKVPETKTNHELSIRILNLRCVRERDVRGIRPTRDTIAKIPLFLAGPKRE